MLLVKHQSCLREEVKDLRYLGSIVDTQGGTEADIKKRISKARVAFHLLRNVWKSKVIGETTKICLFNTNVLLLYRNLYSARIQLR